MKAVSVLNILRPNLSLSDVAFKNYHTENKHILICHYLIQKFEFVSLLLLNESYFSSEQSDTKFILQRCRVSKLSYKA